MEMTGTFVGSVVLSGVCIVFLALVLLIFFVWLFGKIFDGINASQAKKAAEAAAAKKPEAAPAVKAAAPAPVVEDGISDEVVAVIAAAVAAMGAETGRTFSVRSVKRSSGTRRGAWGNAGVSESTRNF